VQNSNLYSGIVNKYEKQPLKGTYQKYLKVFWTYILNKCMFHFNEILESYH